MVGRRRLRRAGATDHQIYHGVKSNDSPENKELFNDPKYSKTQAAKEVKKLWKYILKAFVIDQFEPPKVEPTPKKQALPTTEKQREEDNK